MSKARVLLLTSSLTIIGFSSDSALARDDIFGGRKDGGNKSARTGRNFRKAEQENYDRLFNSLELVNYESLESAAVKVNTKFSNFFNSYNTGNSDEILNNYKVWEDKSEHYSDEMPPLWKDPFLEFLTIKELGQKARKEKIEKNKERDKTLDPLSKGPSKSDVYLPPHKRKRNLRDQPPLTTQRDEPQSNQQNINSPSKKGEVIYIPFPDELTQNLEKIIENTAPTVPSSRSISNHLNKYIIGQDRAMSALATHIYKHYAGLELNNLIQSNPALAAEKGWVHFDKSNMLLIGQSGCGKTASLEHLQHFLNANGVNVKLIMGNASSLTRTGYVGQSASGLIKKALMANNFNIEDTQNKTIIFLDEIDKIAAKSGGGERDIAGADVQGELLRLIQGDVIKIDEGEGPNKRTYFVDTTNMLFITAGAFTGIKPASYDVIIKNIKKNVIEANIEKKTEKEATREEDNKEKDEVIRAETKKNDSMDITSAGTTLSFKDTELERYGLKPTNTKVVVKPLPSKKSTEQIIIEKRFTIPLSELEKYGMKTELLGRLHKRVLFEPVDATGLRRILTEAANSIIQQFKSLLSSPAYEINVEFSDDSFDAIAKKASESKTGARALRSIVDELLDPVLENADDARGTTVIITKEMVELTIPKTDKSEEDRRNQYIIDTCYV